MSEDILTFGPAMRALPEKRRNFVLAMMADPFGNPTAWARRAGYSDLGANPRVKGHILIHDPQIEAAALELARYRMNTVGPLLATQVLLATAANKKHPKQLRAAEMIANRVGMHEMTEHVVNVNHSDRTGKALAERIKAVAAALGVDAAALLGVNAAMREEPLQIEGEVVDRPAAED